MTKNGLLNSLNLTHGEAAVAMITGILLQVMQLYRIFKFATEKTVLNVMLPHIAPEEFFDDRLADTLYAIFSYGIGDLELAITRNMIEVFQIQSAVCHNDTTSVSVYGNVDNNKTDRSIGFEVPMEFSHEDKTYQLRMIILFDHGLRGLKQKALQNRVAKTRDDFKELSGKLNRYKLKTQEQIEAACAAILKKNNTESFFTYTVINNPVTTYKNSKGKYG